MKYVVIAGHSWREERYEFESGNAALAIAEQLAEHHVPEKDEDTFEVRILIKLDPIVEVEPIAAVDAAIENNSKEDEEV